ncbi:MAG: ChaN family lipoprotein [Oligoflexales bacterium]
MASLQHLHQELFQREWNEALSERQNYSNEIERYEKRFLCELSQDASVTSLEALHASILRSHILLYGDFHTSRASVDGCRNILRDLYKNRSLVLCVEIFRAEDQPYIDAYLLGNMTEFDFLEAIQYESDWGFPWKHYQELLTTARDFKIPVYGIDTNRKGLDQLQKRDKFMSQRLYAIQKNNKNSLLICVVGENHLAQSHLPDHLTKLGVSQDYIVRIVNNIDQYFFKCLEQKSSFPIYLSVAERYFCIMNSTPWSKWKSFNMWSDLKASLIEASDHKTYDYNEIRIDLDYHFYEICRDLSDFLGLSIAQENLQKFCIDESSFQWLSGFQKNSTSLQKDYGLYDLDRYTVCFNEHWQDAFPYLAGQFLYHMLHPHFNFSGDACMVFYKYVLWNAIGTMCAKIFDPHFSVMNFYHHKEYLLFYESKNCSQQYFISKEVISVFETIKRKDGLTVQIIKDSFEKCSRGISLEVAYLLGQMIGSECLSRYPFQSNEIDVMRIFFCKDLHNIEDVLLILSKMMPHLDPFEEHQNAA